ncbi:MAG TPA: hypothetical protein VMV94_08400 [Phycisphaerae bacterium]|nr:hypothetical protein [Phycisphaerae bacterium]
MNRKTLFGFGMVLATLAICCFVTFAIAQPKPEGNKPAEKQEAKQPPKMEPKAEPKAEGGKEGTWTGKLMDLHCFMTGNKEEPAKTGECLKAGVPAVLETPTGIVILGKAPKGVDMVAVAGQEVEIKGKLFEKAGVKYVEIATIVKKGGEKKAEPPKAEPKKEEPKKPEPPKTEKPADQPKKPEPPKTK